MTENCLKLKDFTTNQLFELLELTKKCKEGNYIDSLKGLIAINLFFEPSTRTQYSFIVAEEKLGMKVISFSPESSSLKKGETFYDTVRTFESLGADILIIRSKINEYYQQLNNVKVPILNAGDGVKDHPSQSLLDLYTIYEHFGYFKDLKIVIVGDISHSRVAHTNIEVMKRLGIKIYVSGPKEFQDGSAEYIEFEQAVKEMDVVMMLRIQYERHIEDININKEEYLQQFGLDMIKVRIMKKNSIIMHPAPVNRNVEISDEVVECDKSKIFTQMENGVYVRMAMILHSLGEDHVNIN